jgi:simple sugar transport system ATP-binding protein
MILDEPTSVLTPAEADEMLGHLGSMAARKEITVLMISHKFREVKAFCDHFTVLRRGRFTGSGDAKTTSIPDMSGMMIGDTTIRERATRKKHNEGADTLELAGLFADDNDGMPAIKSVNLKIKAGEIVGIAGVSGNGQSALVEALSGQRPLSDGGIFIRGERFEPKRGHYDRFKVFGLPEEPLKNATAPGMSVAENMAFRAFDKPPIASLGWWLSPGPMRARARELIARYNVKTVSPDAPIRDLSGGNVQRAVLARELSNDVDVLIVANPCFGLDFQAAAEIHGRLRDARDAGCAVLLISEDLDELLALSTRLLVLSHGHIAYETTLTAPAGTTPPPLDIAAIGRAMAGDAHDVAEPLAA